jgi:hypothetical protein
MAISNGRSSVTLEDIISKVSEADILSYYLGITEVPCVINSPLRQDKKPSFGLYSRDGVRIFYTDLSTGEKGGLFDLLSQMWNKSYNEVLYKVYSDIPKFSLNDTITSSINTTKTIHNYNKDTDYNVK